MKVRALKGFGGVISMYEGEVREIEDSAAAHDLISCGYIEFAEDKKNKPKGGKKNDAEPDNN